MHAHTQNTEPNNVCDAKKAKIKQKACCVRSGIWTHDKYGLKVPCSLKVAVVTQCQEAKSRKQKCECSWENYLFFVYFLSEKKYIL